MAEKQLTFKENEIIQILNKVYLEFKEGQFARAIELLDRALTIDFEYADISNALKYHVFGRALENYLALYNESELNDPEILLRIGRCHKGRGNYESAISFLE